MITSAKLLLDSLNIRRSLPDEFRDVANFYRSVGYPAPIKPADITWCAWSGSTLIACLSICPEDGIWVLRGPEVLVEYRRHGIGRKLLEVARPVFDSRTCYWLCYSFIARHYASVGFEICPPDVRPERLGRKMKELKSAGWDLVLLTREPSPSQTVA